jgi:hypothetical protein
MSTDAQTIAADGLAGSDTMARPSPGLPWYCYAVVLAAACIPIGVLWDISWHVTIGRDTFWTPAHMMIYLGGALPGCVCGWLVLKNTFWRAPGEQPPAVRLWGFRGPIGAWVVIWGSFVMIVSAPFDNWWHNAYGLDVQIISPPHTVLAIGTYFVAVGGLLLVLSWHNREGSDHRAATTLLLLFACGTLLTKMTVFVTEYSYPNQQHDGSFYRAACLNFPLWLIVAARASGLRWAATGTAGVYTFIQLILVWILPFFPAHPKLAPIYNPVDHMVPPPFPLLLILPALAIDLLMQRGGRSRGFWADTRLALIIGVGFFLVLLAVQWPFSEFLLSPASRNAVFAGNAMWGYNANLGPWCTQFWDLKEDPFTLKTVCVSIFYACLMTRIGLAFGNWLSTIKR